MVLPDPRTGRFSSAAAFGALAIPDISWFTIVKFAARRRVIVPAHPSVATMDALVDGITAILQREGVEQAHVMGGSYGGFVAQVFVRRHPQLTRSLVLSHTLPPYPEIWQRGWPACCAGPLRCKGACRHIHRL